MRVLGAPDPESWARSELDGDIPQEVTWLLLRDLWPQLIDRYAQEEVLRHPAAARAVAAGADLADVAKIMRVAAYEAVFGTLYRLSADEPDGPDDAPAWVVREVRRDGGVEQLGRVIECLHESLLTCDPSGNEGADLWV